MLLNNGYIGSQYYDEKVVGRLKAQSPAAGPIEHNRAALSLADVTVPCSCRTLTKFYSLETIASDWLQSRAAWRLVTDRGRQMVRRIRVPRAVSQAGYYALTGGVMIFLAAAVLGIL
jgi:hypothetical protein